MELSYWKKQDQKPLFENLSWNIPEQKTGTVNVVGGNSQSFVAPIKAAEFISSKFPISRTNVVLPDSLKNKVPPLPNIILTPSTDSGSFAKDEALEKIIENGDFSIFIGDMSKNSITTVAISDAIKNTTKPVILARDSIGTILPEAANIIERESLFIMGSMAQLQKLLRAIYYPKMLLLSMPILPAIELLHKFTISYSATIITFHEDQIIVASGGKIITTPIDKTKYSPITLWDGTLACKIAALNLYNPNQSLEASSAAILS